MREAWLESNNSGGFIPLGKKFSVDCPAPTVMSGGMAGDSYSHWFLMFGEEMRTRTALKKPDYCIPTMREIAALPWNGLKVASTFSGCGGSCLGYRMAGFRVVWANEFDPKVRASYEANRNPECVLDPRDIKEVRPEEILEATGLKEGELDLFDGSPPCQAFSTAGKREKNWGRKKKYDFGVEQCNETLFEEYIRILHGLMPRTFVAENVSGLVKGTAKGYFLEILAALKASGYRVTARVLDAQWLGVPQQRQRVIFVGAREDLKTEPAHPSPLPYRYSVRDAIPGELEIPSNCMFDDSSGRMKSAASPSRTVRSSGHSTSSRITVVQDPKGKFAVLRSGTGPCFTTKAGSAAQVHVEDLPPSRRKPGAYNLSEVWPGEPCPTVTCASPGNDLAVLDGAVFSRKLTIGELKRICSFPDDFVLVGSYAKQWYCLGNSVPPVMMRAIAETVRDRVLLAGR